MSFRWKRSFLGIIIILVVLCVIGWLWYAKHQDSLSFSQPSRTSDSTASINWKTYSNEKYGFTISFPSDWSSPKPFELVGENMRTYIYPGGYFEGCCSGVEISIIEKHADLVYQDFLRNYPTEDILSVATVNFTGLQVKELTLDTHYGAPSRTILVPFEGRTIELVHGNEDSLASQIVGTFHLIR